MADDQQRTVYLEWDILYKSKSTKKIKDNAIQELLKGISSQVTAKVKSVLLDYEVFRSEQNKLLYILRVYEQNSSSSIKPKATVGDAGAVALSGPIHPPGRPTTPPDGVVSIEEW